RIAFTSSIRSARYRSLSASKLAASTTYIMLVARIIRAKAESAYHAVSRAASDQRLPAGFSEAVAEAFGAVAGFESLMSFKDITHAAHGLNQLALKRIVHFAPQPPHVDIHHVRVRVEIHIPHLLGDERA